MTDTTASLMREKEEKDEKEKKAMFNKQRQLLDGSNEEERENTLTDYALYEQLRTKKANNLYVIEKCKNNLAKCQENIDNSLKEISEINSKFPSYKNDYINKYIEEMKQVGIDPKQMELLKYMFSEDLSQEIKEEINPTKINLISTED
jgi:phosphotransacetylase